MLSYTGVAAVVHKASIVFAATVSVLFIVRAALPRSTAEDPDWLDTKFSTNVAFKDGFFHSKKEGSGSFEEEVEATATMLKLKPGMTYCEMGAANGLWASALAAKVMPGGRFIGSVGTTAEIPVLRAAMSKAGIPTTIVRGTDDTSGFPQDASCDAFMSRMSFFFIKKPDAYASDFYAAVRPGGRMFISDHAPDVTYEGAWTGPRGMRVTEDGELVFNRVKPEDEANDFKQAGFQLIQQLDWTKYYHNGYGNLFTK